MLDDAALLLLGPVLEDVLHDECAVPVHGQGHPIRDQEVDDGGHLARLQVLQHPLQPAISIFVPRQPARGLRAALQNVVDDELAVARPHGDNDLLQDVVRVRTPHHVPSVAPQSIHDGQPVAVVRSLVQGLLDPQAALAIMGEFHRVLGHHLVLGLPRLLSLAPQHLQRRRPRLARLFRCRHSCRRGNGRWRGRGHSLGHYGASGSLPWRHNRHHHASVHNAAGHGTAGKDTAGHAAAGHDAPG
mmetsp:Transcript_45112/g.136770  ORF Transcript_45112/g.136770 Transcript_45112/m.136770 type:complete len:244 (-) Transcript_45112:148-879(-)